MSTDITELIAKAREEVAPYRADLDAGKWVSGIGLILNVERLANALEALNRENEALTTKWEYAARITPPSGSYGDDVFYEYPDLLAVDRFIKNPPLWYSPRQGEVKAIVRRRKAGPWVEVPLP